MNRLSAALAAVAVLSFRTAWAEPCAPRVVLSGDRDEVARVAVELKTLGVELGAAARSACSVTAMVVREGDGISVAVQNPAKRSEGRVVSDAKIAAAWIDSWLRDEIEVASWTVDEPPAAASLTPPSAIMATAVPAPGVSPLEQFGLSAALERSWTDDETTWNGFDLAGCMRIGVACIGGRVRAGFQDDLAYNATMADRSDVVALATASIPVSLGQVSIAPELGLGVGRTRTTRVEACQPVTTPEPSPGCSDPMDPTCMSPPTPEPCLDASGNPTNTMYVGDEFDQVTYLPRVAVALRVAFPIVRHVWLDAVAAYTLSPFASTSVVDTMINDPNTGTGTATDMPPEPSRGYQLGVGIRVGIP